MTETIFSYRDMTKLARMDFRAGFRAGMGRPDAYALADIDLDLKLRAETQQVVKISDQLADRMGMSFAMGYAFGRRIKQEATR